MALWVSLSFDGNCAQALKFYEEVFGLPAPEIMCYGDMPEGSDFVLSDEDKKRVMFSSLDILGTTVMFSDAVPGMPFITGNHMGMAVVLKDTQEITRLFDALKVGGSVEMELQQVPWSELYGMLTDRFGVQWQFDIDCEMA